MPTTYRWSTTVEVIQILVKGVAVELDGDDLFRRGVCDPERLLQAFQNALAVL